MATSPVFDWVSQAIQDQASVQELQARGMLRFALRQGGLDAATVTASEMRAVIEKLLPGQLRRSGVPNPEALCVKLVVRMNAQSFAESKSSSETAQAFFRRVLRPDAAR